MLKWHSLKNNHSNKTTTLRKKALNHPFGWQVAEVYLKSYGWVRHQLDAYAYFIQNIVTNTIIDSIPFHYETENYIFKFRFNNVFIHRPSITEYNGNITKLLPNEARLRNLSYSAPVFVQVIKSLELKQSKTSATKTAKKNTFGNIESAIQPIKNGEIKETICVGMIPVMTKSILCNLHNATEEELITAKEDTLDQGGYFIINGSERVLMGMERPALNNIFIFPNSHDPDDLYAEISSFDEGSRKSASQFYIHLNTSNALGKICLRSWISYFKREFPIGIILRALGASSNTSFKELLLHKFTNITLEPLERKELISIIDTLDEESYHIKDQEAAFKYLGSISATEGLLTAKRNTYIHAVLQKELLPHIGIEITSYPQKIEFILYMIYKLLNIHFKATHERNQERFEEANLLYDDHDHEKNKRTDCSGFLLGNIFKQVWGKITKELNMLVKKKLETNTNLSELNLSPFMNNVTTFTKDLSYCLASGNWSVIRNSRMKTGVSQALNRFNHQAVLSHCRRIINPMPKNSILSKPRQIHNSSYGLVCPFESPEGASIGLVKNMAMGCHISIHFPDTRIHNLITDYLREKKNNTSTIPIFLNGKIIGWDDSDKLIHNLRSLRRQGYIPYDISLAFDRLNNEINIFTDAGRKCRPVFVVTDNKILLDKPKLDEIIKENKGWQDFISEGLIELIDAAEQESLLISNNIEDLGNDGLNYTHAEISDALIIGLSASIIPYGNSNPAPRSAFQSSMSKQAISIPGLNWQWRMDTQSHVLYYPQKPLVQTDAMDLIEINEEPASQQAIVAIISRNNNMEDAIEVCKSALERGLFRSVAYRTFKDQESRLAGAEEYFGKPNDPAAHKLDFDGFVRPGTRVVEGDIIIGKISRAVNTDGTLYQPRSVIIHSGEHGIVDQVIMSQNPDGTKIVKIRVRQERVPIVGDKFAAAHSQKGIIGNIFRQEDGPYTAVYQNSNGETVGGIVPDVIINPHSQPSRMTIGHLKEIRSGKLSAIGGKFHNATICSKTGNRQAMEEMGSELKKLGYNRQGWEVMYDGTTGEQLDALIYVGICSYQRLKHMVCDKLFARSSKGPIETISHQPLSGRHRESKALRVGEMERDAMISHGGSFHIKERLMNLSDKFKIPICKSCGLIAIRNMNKHISICKACKSSNICLVYLPCSVKVLIQSMMAIGLAIRLHTS